MKLSFKKGSLVFYIHLYASQLPFLQFTKFTSSFCLSVCLFVLFSLAGRRAKGGEREGMNAKWKGWGSVQIVKAHFS